MKSLLVFPVFLFLPCLFIHAQNVENDLKISDAFQTIIENEVDGGIQSINIVTETDDDFADAYISLVEACEVNHSNLNIVRVEVTVEENQDLVYVGVLSDAQTEISVKDIVAHGKRSNDSDMGLESTRWRYMLRCGNKTSKAFKLEPRDDGQHMVLSVGDDGEFMQIYVEME